MTKHLVKPLSADVLAAVLFVYIANSLLGYNVLKCFSGANFPLRVAARQHGRQHKR